MKTWKEATEKLTDTEPRASAWNELAARLEFEEHLTEELGNLPESTPDEEAWLRIENILSSTVKVHTSWYQRWQPLAAAASVTVMVGLGIWYANSPSQEATITYTIESVDEWKSPAPELPQSNKAEAFIAESCRRKIPLCNTPDFRTLKGELDELNAQKARIEREIRMFGENDDLVQAQIKIENQRAEIAKELVQKLMI